VTQPGSPLDLFGRFALLSLIAVGGANAVIPDMHRQFVEAGDWMSDGEFAALFAIAQAAPGPNVLITTLIGWKIAGVAGALAATAGMTVPSCLLTFAVMHAWERFKGARWRGIIQLGLAPVTIGFVLASGYILARAADGSLAAGAITAATALAVLTTRLNPLFLLAGAGLLGLAGLV
jgi:chromate transporter